MKKLFAALFCCIAGTVMATDIYLLGDSTICKYGEKRAPLMGWGMALPQYCKPGVNVINEGSSGASSWTIQDRGNWDNVINKMKAGDFVVIQFGHNDQKKFDPKKPHNHCSLAERYPANLTKFIREIKAKGGNPVIATSIVRLTFDKKTGELADKAGLRAYCDAAIKVAEKEGVPCVDMNKLTTDLVKKLGPEESKKFYMILAPGASPNYPKGQKDSTHLQAEGAQTYAGLFVQAAKDQKLPIAELFH